MDETSGKRGSVRRKSNVELLRIVCIFLIILRHYSTQVGWGEFTAQTWSWQLLFLQLISIGGSTANNIFLLISGYYMLGREVNWKRVVLLICEMFFYSWAVMLIVFGLGIVPFSVGQFIEGLVPIWHGYNWYVCCYVILCCFLPFLNPFLEGLTQEKYKKFLIVSLLLWSVGYTLRMTNYLGTDFSIDHFVIIYALGGYIKKFGITLKRLSWKWAFFASGAILAATVIIQSFGGYVLGKDALIANATFFANATSIVDVSVALCLFMWIIEATPFYSAHINAVAKSVLGIFLLHHNPLIRRIIWYMIFPNIEYFHSALLPVHCLVKVSCVFLACLAIDQLRLHTVHKAFTALIDTKWESITLTAQKLAKRLE